MDDVKKSIRQRYAEIARQAGSSCCDRGEADTSHEALGYERTDVEMAPTGSNMGLGCGNPTAIADLQPGETVLDLGSGGGFDCFLAANAVGPEGTVIGVDMTEEMVCAARENAASAGYSNVEFRLGEIEALPVGDASVDVVISNCVINLVPDKDRAFAEVARVLKPGGRLHISDIVLNGELPAGVLDDEDAYVSCIAGAVTKEKYLSTMRENGLGDIEIVKEQDATELLEGCCETEEDGCGCGVRSEGLEGVVSSITISARRPG